MSLKNCKNNKFPQSIATIGESRLDLSKTTWVTTKQFCGNCTDMMHQSKQNNAIICCTKCRDIIDTNTNPDIGHYEQIYEAY